MFDTYQLILFTHTYRNYIVQQPCFVKHSGYMRALAFCTFLMHNIKQFPFVIRCKVLVCEQSIAQWFLKFFKYLSLLSNKITRFTPNTLNGADLLKIRN